MKTKNEAAPKVKQKIWSIECSNGTILTIHKIAGDKWGIHAIVNGEGQNLSSYQMYFMNSTFLELKKLLDKILGGES